MTTSKTSLSTIAEIRRAYEVQQAIEIIEDDIGSKFYGLENRKADGSVRLWSLAPHAPGKALDAIKGGRADGPAHILKRWCNIRKAWRSINLATVTRITYTDSDGVKNCLRYPPL